MEEMLQLGFGALSAPQSPARKMRETVFKEREGGTVGTEFAVTEAGGRKPEAG